MNTLEMLGGLLVILAGSTIIIGGILVVLNVVWSRQDIARLDRWLRDTNNRTYDDYTKLSNRIYELEKPKGAE